MITQMKIKKQNNSVMEEQNSKQEKVITIPEGWEVKNIDGQNIVIVEKENEVDRLPKTWNECLKILGEFENLNAYSEVVKSNISNYIEHGKEDYKILPVGLGEPMLALSQLLICRNAWWKELNWNPYVGERETSYCIVKNYSGQVDRRNYDRGNIRVLIFPTGDVRDKFLRTFKDLIKKAKDLL